MLRSEQAKLVSAVILGSLLWSLSHTQQVLFSFENTLHGFTSTGATLNYVSGIGNTHENYSMQVDWDGSFTWLTGGSIPGLATALAANRILLADITVPPGSAAPWSEFLVALRHSDNTWHQTDYGPFYLPRQVGLRTVLMDLRPLPVDISGVTFNIGISAGVSRTIYIDNIRQLDTSLLRPLFDFEGVDLHGFTPQDSDIVVSRSTDWASTGSHSMRVQWTNGFNWLFSGGGSSQQAKLLNRGKLLVMDVHVPPTSNQGAWWNMIVAFNHGSNWFQEDDPVGFPSQPGTYTIAIDYRSIRPNINTSGTYVNLGFNAQNTAGQAIVYIDNIRVLIDPQPGDVNDDGCVDDIDLLSVLFAYGLTGSLPEDVNRDNIVNDLDLAEVLSYFGNGAGC